MKRASAASAVRRALVTCAVAIAALWPSTARAHVGEHSIVFGVQGTVPCGSPEPGTGICPRDPGGRLAGLTDCTNPPPHVAAADILTEPAPDPPETATVLLQLYTFAAPLNWDIAVCFADGAPLEADRYVSYEDGPTLLDFLRCCNPCWAGCYESIVVRVEPGKRYALRAFNHGDVDDLPGIYRWIFV